MTGLLSERKYEKYKEKKKQAWRGKLLLSPICAAFGAGGGVDDVSEV